MTIGVTEPMVVLATDREIARLSRSANGMLLAYLIEVCKFGWVNRSITSERLSVLDALEMQPFLAIIDHPGREMGTDNLAKRLVGKAGTTSQFLRYLHADPTAGMEFHIAHLASECVDAIGRPCCLSVGPFEGKRNLSVPWLEGGPWTDDWRFFGAEALA